jgi:Ferritin-like
MDSPKLKFIALNASSARINPINSHVVGNPVNTRLESGVGNCFPGLEMDLRNLERRFFPFLSVDFIDDNTIAVASVDTNAVQNSDLPQNVQNLYQAVALDMNGDGVTWTVDKIAGSFGPFGRREITLANLGPANAPPDSWTAVRLLPEGQTVEITLGRRTEPRAAASRTIKLKQPRVAYLDSNGVFAEMFEPGELSQSLCSPWTHDFRDCACFYWASNHPDIVQPPAPEGREDEPEWQLKVPWERADRGTPDNPSPAATPLDPGPIEMDHYEINTRWQELDIALEGREIRKAYRPGVIGGRPYQTQGELESQLNYAAGVELAAAQVYLTAAYSLKPDSSLAGDLKNDVVSAFAELMRVAISEMRHLRVVNDVLRALNDKAIPPTPFRPALRVAKEFPPLSGTNLPVVPSPITPDVLQQFIEIEKPSLSVDGLYSRILSTLEQLGFPEQAAAIRSVMAEGLDHYQTFLFVNEWLGRHPKPSDYLNPARTPSASDRLHVLLQTKYRELLQTLRTGYAAGLPRGAEDIAAARKMMLGGGLEDICEQHRSSGLLVVFKQITDDARFSPIDRPKDS